MRKLNVRTSRVLILDVQGANPVSVKVTLRGKKYDVKDATSVEDVQKSVEEQAGLAKEQQVPKLRYNDFIPLLMVRTKIKHAHNRRSGIPSNCLRFGDVLAAPLGHASAAPRCMVYSILC